jgi:hypothetical protein
VGLRVVEGPGQQVIEDAREDPVPVGGDLHGWDPGPVHGSLEEAAGRLCVPPWREEDIDDLAELVDGPEQVAPYPSDLDVGLIDVPAIPDNVLSSPRGLDELRREPLDPPVDAHMVDLDASFGEELLDVPVGEAEPQVPPDGQGDDLGRNR